MVGGDFTREYSLRAAHFDALAARLAAAIARTVPSSAHSKERIAVLEPVGVNGLPWITPHAKIFARRLAAALREKGISASSGDFAGAAVKVCGRLETHSKPDRLVVELEVRSGSNRLGTVRDTMLATGEVADLVLGTNQHVLAGSNHPASLGGLRDARVEATEDSLARHPHFTDYDGLPVSLRFELCDAAGDNPEPIRPVEVGGECYLPVEKGKCLRIIATRRSSTPCAMLVLIDGGNVMSSADLPDDARFASPNEHLARLNYFILDERREYAVGEWITLGAERKDGSVAARRLMVADGPNAVGYRQPGAELGEIRILLYAARKPTEGERAAMPADLGMGAGAATTLPMSFVRWRADTSVSHARLVYRYRQAGDIPSAASR
jgi:hypothetical protein